MNATFAYHELVPKGLRKNLALRVKVLKEAQRDLDFRAGILEMCRRDCLFWINLFAWQYNPEHLGDEIGPFLTWDFQDAAVRDLLGCVNDREDARWPKSREMGASWLVLLVIVWICLFHPHKKALVVSRDEDAVDRPDDPDCLFWKIAFIHEYMPDWMSQGVRKRKMGFRYASGSTIFGEANTPKAGVGGRATIALFDEFGQFKDGLEVYSRTADTSHCRIFVGTHKDSNSMFYDLCHDVKYRDMREIKTHWSQHPEKRRGLYRFDEKTNQVEIIDKTYQFDETFVFVMDGKPTGGPFPGLRSPWYDKECRRRPARAVAMDLDIDPRGATSQFFDSQVIAYLKNNYAREPVWIGELKFDKEKGQPLELVENPKGKLRLWVSPKSDKEVPVGRYGGGADISWGTGATPTCLSLANAATGDKVLEFTDAHMSPLDACPLFMAIGRLFADKDGVPARLCWEIQGPGVVFGRRMIALGYENMYYREDEDALGKPRNNKMLPGWNPSQTRAVLDLMGNYQQALRDRRFLNPSWDALDECLNFVYTPKGIEYKKKGQKDDDPTNARIHHGDIVVADALCWKMIQNAAREVIVREDKPLDVRSLAGRRLHREQERRELESWA